MGKGTKDVKGAQPCNWATLGVLASAYTEKQGPALRGLVEGVVHDVGLSRALYYLCPTPWRLGQETESQHILGVYISKGTVQIPMETGFS